MKILLVSDLNAYSTFDVFMGYIRGFTDLHIPFEVVNYHQLLDTHSNEYAQSLILAKMLIKENGFTHCLFISGVMIPRWLLESKYDLQLGYISTDDPHASNLLLVNKDIVKYYFTNEATMVNESERRFYLPTAVSVDSIELDKEVGNKKYKSDVCFIGSIYPNRVKPLELVLQWCLKNNKKMALYGPEQFIPKTSILRKHIYNQIVKNEDSLKFYANSKCVINLNRDPNWHPHFDTNPDLATNVEPYSTNPRAYEVAICNTPQLFIEPRRESLMLFKGDAFYCSNNRKAIWDQLDRIFLMDAEEMNGKLKTCYKTVANNHTYTHRCSTILDKLIHY